MTGLVVTFLDEAAESHIVAQSKQIRDLLEEIVRLKAIIEDHEDREEDRAFERNTRD